MTAGPGLMARYDSDEALRARITEMYLQDRPLHRGLISLAVSLVAGRREAVDFANAATNRIKSDRRH